MDYMSEVISSVRKDKDKISTPSYIYLPEVVDRNYASLKECLGTKLIVSVKANSNSDLLNLANFEKDGYEVTSLEELNIVTQLGAKEKFINNPSMNQELIHKAVLSGTTIIVDNLNQIKLLAKVISSSVDNEVSIMLRVNAKDMATFFESNSALKGDLFGLSVIDIMEAIKVLKELNIKVLGLHIFKGSHSFFKQADRTAIEIKKLVTLCEDNLSYKLEKINFGGGFSSDWHCSGFDFEAYRNRISSLFDGYDLYHESGRGLFETAGVYVTKVISTKELNDSHIAICDGGLAHNFLLAQTESTFKKFRSPTYVIQDRPAFLDKQCIIIGSSCNKDDVVGKLSEGQAALGVDDLVLFNNCGAYNETYSPVNFLSLKKSTSYIYFCDESGLIDG